MTAMRTVAPTPEDVVDTLSAPYHVVWKLC